jgi:hypothetical protein
MGHAVSDDALGASSLWVALSTSPVGVAMPRNAGFFCNRGIRSRRQQGRNATQANDSVQRCNRQHHVTSVPGITLFISLFIKPARGLSLPGAQSANKISTPQAMTTWKAKGTCLSSRNGVFAREDLQSGVVHEPERLRERPASLASKAFV